MSPLLDKFLLEPPWTVHDVEGSIPTDMAVRLSLEPDSYKYVRLPITKTQQVKDKDSARCILEIEFSHFAKGMKINNSNVRSLKQLE